MRTILIVEDDVSAAKVLRERLLASGFSVAVAGDAYQALTAAKNDLPDLIIMDLMLPAGGGQSAVKNIKMSFKTSSIPILVLTAAHDAELKNKLLAEGADGYMEKPYEPVELIATINKILQKVGK